jgi:imidazolonepropionase-like amidohydrolase/Tol biopolymer transport system component
MKFWSITAILGLALPLVASLAAPALAQDAANEDSERWDVAAPPLPTRSVDLNVDEGTWMSLDVSPDGQTIAFDLLGDIYTMPIAGGEATNISSGLPWEYQPRFSNAGTQIAFTSDRGGGDNIWIMNVDGTDKRQLTNEQFRLLNNPTWSADDRYIAAKKHFTTTRSLGTGEIWLYHLGGGNGVALVERPSEAHQKELGEPIFSPDGRSIYYSLNITSGPIFEYAQDSNTNLFAIDRYDMATGDTTRVVSGHGGSVRPAPSPDGTSIAFVRRERTQSKLYIKDLASGQERRIYGALDQDMQETWGVQGMYPNMDWTPDGQSIIFWAGGKIRRVNVETGEAAIIPFTVNDTREIIDPPRPRVEVAPDTFTTRLPKFAAVSPDGTRAVFETLGKLYIKALPDGETRRISGNDDDTLELFPNWSADGSALVYATWSDKTLGTLVLAAPDGTTIRTLTTEPGHYRRPRFAPDGQSIVYEKRSGGYLMDGNWSEATGIYHMQIDGGQAKRITDNGRAPHFASATDRIFLTRSADGGGQQLVSIDLNGEAERVHAKGTLVTGFQVSPDGQHLAFGENYHAFVMPMTPGPQMIGAGSNGSALPITRASADGAAYMHWSNADTLNWTLGPDLFSATLSNLIPDAPKSEQERQTYAPPERGISLAFTAEANKPSGTIALTGARIITMADDAGGIIENATILIKDNRIEAIGPTTDIEIPESAQTLNLEGKTILPGFIDAHAHGPQGRDDIVPGQNWSAIAHLALGVTTIHDPSSTASEIFTAAERQRAGTYLSPRIYSSGEIVYGAKSPTRYAQIDSLDDAREHVRRLSIQGAHSIKNYNQPRRDQRQQVIAAALEEDIAVVAEGGSLFHMDMALIADGNTSLEHNLPQSQLYEDVLSFYAATKVAYTPTLVVTYGGPAGDPYWRQATDVWTHPILSAHVPPHVLQPGSVRRTTAPESDFADQVSAATATLLADRGVAVSIGAHGQQEGLGSHWEIWSFVRGGMSELGALQAATIAPATHLGFDQDIGSLETGKLADLVILSANPLEDIRNTEQIEHIMLNGRLYEAKTMNEHLTGDSVRKPYYWEK